MSAVARLRIEGDALRTQPRPYRPDQPEFRSQLQQLREASRDENRGIRDRDPAERDRLQPKRPVDRDEDDVVIYDRPAQPEGIVHVVEFDAIEEGLGELTEMVRGSQLARGSGQIALPQLPPQPPVQPVATKLSEHGATALTPLEQAVHDLIGRIEPQIDETDESGVQSLFTAEAAPIAAPELKGPPPISAPKMHAAIAPVRDLPEMASPSSHVHLVIDDGADRIVVTVAVRGNDVNVALRGGDDTTSSSLARNAGSLDHALRARGLDLSEFTAEPDRESAQHERPEQPRDDHASSSTFSLTEEIA